MSDRVWYEVHEPDCFSGYWSSVTRAETLEQAKEAVARLEASASMATGLRRIVRCELGDDGIVTRESVDAEEP